MALIDFSNIHGDQQASEQQQYLQAHYEAIFLRRRALDAARHRPREVPQAPELEPDEAPSAPVIKAKAPPSPERRRALREYAERMTGKRRSHDENTS